MKKLFLAVLLIRLILSFLPAMQIDMGAWQAWAMRMVEVGPAHFYSSQIFTDNPPGYLYIFWGIGEIWAYLANWPNWANWLGSGGFIWLLKLPANLFDLGTGLLIYKIISHKRGGLSWLGLDLAKLGFLLYTLNPAIWFNASVFGQFDGAGAFFGLLAVYLTISPISQIRLIYAGAAFAMAWAVKPQAIALAPAIGILAFRESFSRRNLAKARFRLLKLGVGFLGTTLLLYWPFFPKNPLAGILYVQQRMTQIYSCTTCFSFNFWGLWGNWLDDRVLFLGVPLMVWGIILGGLGMFGVLWGLVKFDKLDKFDQTYLAISLSIMAFNMLATRMHERYVLPFFAFFLIAALLLKSKKLIIFYLFFSLFNLLNVYYPYASYNTNLHLTPGLVAWLGENFRLLSMVGFGSFLVLVWWYISRAAEVGYRKFFAVQNPAGSLPPLAGSFRSSKIWYPPRGSQVLSWSKREIIIVFLLVFVSFLIRVIRLDTPKTFYFDEVYHAFTAVEMEKGNKMAWEWWNSPPQGFAYEWTHPPLAKELMVLGVRGIRWIRGIGGLEGFGGVGDAFEWRFPGVILGTGCVLLVYLLARELFGKRAGFFAGFLFSFDGLSFTQSRIGMNDIYFLFFMLLAFYLFVRSSLNNVHVYTRKGISLLVLMGISLGLALSSKWTAIYGIGILGGLYIISGLTNLIKAWPCKAARPGLVKLVVVSLLTFLIIPLAVYLLTYLPFFQSGHTWQQFDELQHQMWWYHTGLKATHPYTSPWYSWPFMQRPVWYYVNYGISQISPIGQIGKPTIANLYAMGNPVIWWGGIGAVAAIIFNFQFSIFKIIRSLILRRQPKNLSRMRGRQQVARFFTSFRMTIKVSEAIPLLIVLLGYFGFFLPWALSPRIMFLYHYLPSLSFLCLALGYGLDKIWQIGSIGQIGKRQINGKFLATFYLLLATLTFVYFYPHWSALPVPKWWAEQYFWFASWR